MMTDRGPAPKAQPGFPEGHPMHNHQSDPKLVDDTGRAVVVGKPWSQCSTGLFLNVLVSKDFVPKLDRAFAGRDTLLPGSSGLWLHISSTWGKPVSSNPTWGSCLEIPSDLGQDPLKQQYVTEWVIETTREAVSMAGGDPDRIASARQGMVDAVEAALVEQGL